MPVLISRILPLAALALLPACDRGASPASVATAGSVSSAAATEDTRDRDRAPAASASPVRTAARPPDACGWISAAEVAKIVGQLTGAPYTTDDGCVYPLPLDTAIAHRNDQLAEVRRQLAARLGESPFPPPEPDTSGVIVDVEVYNDPAAARGAGAALAKIGHDMCDDSASKNMPWCREAERRAASPVPPPPGWDRSNDPPSQSFFGQLGHITVRVRVHGAEVTREQSIVIANHIRDAIPDLPFPATKPPAAAGPDPCVLLKVEEVEPVLGKLVVPPYRSDEETPLAMTQGKSCTYFTAGHHALVLTPTWEYGGMAFDGMRAIGGLIERVAPVLHDGAADTLDSGPWEDAAGDPATGQLYFLKGDRALELGFLVSSTDFDGAVRLARIAVGRL
ncbi:MAG TPA: hypothetical protein VFW66_08030 [Gemmatimonadales bacterium]|nr:hypothetical protein [Gemmatimonadales bacterium]